MVSPCLHTPGTKCEAHTYYLLSRVYDAGAHGSIGSMAPHAIDGGGIMACRAKGTARAGTRTGGQARGRDKLDWLVPSRPLLSPLFSIIPHLARLSPRLPLISTRRLVVPVAHLPT